LDQVLMIGRELSTEVEVLIFVEQVGLHEQTLPRSFS
jgi:hypothetical protein